MVIDAGINDTETYCLGPRIAVTLAKVRATFPDAAILVTG